MKVYGCLWIVLLMILTPLACEAGTLTLKDGDVLTFNNEKEFVELLVEEFLPLNFPGKTGFFIISDFSEQHENLQILLTQPEELDIQQNGEVSVYSSIDSLTASQEYQNTIVADGEQGVFAVEMSLADFDMIFVYKLDQSSHTRGLSENSKNSEPFIDARGEGHFELLEASP